MSADDQAALERAMQEEIEREALEAEMQRELSSKAETPSKPKKLDERMAAYAAATSTPVTPSRDAVEAPEVRRAVGSVRLPEAFTAKKDEDDAKELKRQEEARVDGDKKKKLTDRWLQREETAAEPELKKTVPDVKADGSARNTWELRAEGKVEEKPVERVNRVDVSADKSKFDEWNKRAEGKVEEKPVEKVNRVDVSADKSKFDEWNKRAEGKVEEKPVEKVNRVDAHGDKSKFDEWKQKEANPDTAIVGGSSPRKVEIEAKADKSKFEEWNKRAEGNFEVKPVERTVKVDAHGDKSKFNEWKQKEANPETPLPEKHTETPKKTGNVASRWNPDKVPETPPEVHTGDVVMSVSARGTKVSDRWKPEEASKPDTPTKTEQTRAKASITSRWNPEGAAKELEKPAAAPSPAKGSVTKRWEPVVTPADAKAKAHTEQVSANKADVSKRWNPEPSSAPIAQSSPSPAPSSNGVSRGNVVKRWNPVEEHKDAPKTVEAPKAGGKIAGRWNVSEDAHAPVTGSRASEIEELRRLKEEQKAKESRDLGVIAGPTYSSAVEVAIIAHIAQSAVKGDKELGAHTFSTDTAMGAELADGVLLCRLFDKLIPGVIDVRAVTKTPADARDKAENWNLVIGSARSVGCRLHTVQAEACASGNVPQIQLVLWEAIRVSYEQRVKRAKVYLEGAFPSEKVADVLKWPVEELLGKWASGFVKARGLNRQVDDVTKDLTDGEVLAAIVAAVVPASASVAKLSDKGARIDAVVEAVNKLDNGTLASKEGIAEGVHWQLYVVLSTLFLKASTVVW